MSCPPRSTPKQALDFEAGGGGGWASEAVWLLQVLQAHRCQDVPTRCVFCFLRDPQNGGVPFGFPSKTTQKRHPQNRQSHMRVFSDVGILVRWVSKEGQKESNHFESSWPVFNMKQAERQGDFCKLRAVYQGFALFNMGNVEQFTAICAGRLWLDVAPARFHVHVCCCCCFCCCGCCCCCQPGRRITDVARAATSTHARTGIKRTQS